MIARSLVAYCMTVAQEGHVNFPPPTKVLLALEPQALPLSSPEDLPSCQFVFVSSSSQVLFVPSLHCHCQT